MQIKMVPIASVVAYARNPRKNDDAIAKVAASLREFGFRQPIVCDEKMTVIVGHTRLAAARSLDMKTVPVHVAKGLTATQVKAYRLADNRTAEEAEWDVDMLALELNDLELDDFDLSLTGFGETELRKTLGRTDESEPGESERLGVVEYQIVITCEGERAQATLCKELESRGLQCRLLTL